MLRRCATTVGYGTGHGKSQYETSDGRALFGYHIDRMNGLSDFLPMARGKTVLDVGCDRGLISLAFAMNGATLVHGCDKYAMGVQSARQVLNEAGTTAHFEVVDLTGGFKALQEAFAGDLHERYDIVLFLSMYHILKNRMADDQLLDLVRTLIERSGRYFIYRRSATQQGYQLMDRLVEDSGLVLTHYSWFSKNVGPLLIYERRAA